MGSALTPASARCSTRHWGASHGNRAAVPLPVLPTGLGQWVLDDRRQLKVRLAVD